MGDLHSIAYNSNDNNSLHNSSLGWDFHNIGVLNADISQYWNIDSTPPPKFSPSDFDHSTGYLQDALCEFNDRAKRRRLLFDHQLNKGITNSVAEQEGCWVSSQTGSHPEIISYLSQMTCSSEALEMKTSEEEMSESEVFDYSSSSPRDSSATTNSIPKRDAIFSSLDHQVSENQEKSAMSTTRVVYPFEVVKPGGTEGDLTLNDINRRILMTPTRPVKHPVGDYACRPVVVSPHGPGLSGKAVVAFTRLHTRDRKGTITIIRTKG